MTEQLEQNKALVTQMFDEIWNKRQFDKIETFYAPNMVAGIQEFIGAHFAAFTDWQFIADIVIAERDLVAVRWRNTGIHQAEYWGIQASGRRIMFEGISLLRIADGKIIHDEAQWDEPAIRQQLNGEVKG